MADFTFTFRTTHGATILATDNLKKGQKAAIDFAIRQGYESLEAVTGNGSVFFLTPLLDQERERRRSKDVALAMLEAIHLHEVQEQETYPEGWPFK
jgi:hypothetical protein